jgi:hypothetical protein
VTAREPNRRKEGTYQPVFLDFFFCVGPLSKWTKAEVEAWLEKLKTEFGLEFEVASVAAAGPVFANRSEAILKEMAGGPVGYDIWMAKEKLLAREEESQAGMRCLLFPLSFHALRACSCLPGWCMRITA